MALRIGSFKAQLGSEAQMVFRVLFVSPSPGDFPTNVDFILRPLPCVRKMAVAAPGYIFIAHDLKAREAISLPSLAFEIHGRLLLGHMLKPCPIGEKGTWVPFLPDHI